MHSKGSEVKMSLILCKDGRLAPAVIICRHLHEGTSTTWVEIPAPGQDDPDYFCPGCVGRFIELGATGAFPDDDDLVAVCLHCARERRRASSGKVFAVGNRCLVEKPDESEAA
jgi:hypothetical protein